MKNALAIFSFPLCHHVFKAHPCPVAPGGAVPDGEVCHTWNRQAEGTESGMLRKPQECTHWSLAESSTHQAVALPPWAILTLGCISRGLGGVRGGRMALQRTLVVKIMCCTVMEEKPRSFLHCLIIFLYIHFKEKRQKTE